MTVIIVMATRVMAIMVRIISNRYQQQPRCMNTARNIQTHTRERGLTSRL